MQVFDFTGGREITHPPAKSGIKEQLPELGSVRVRAVADLRTYPLEFYALNRPARSKSNQHAAQPERSQSQENAGRLRARRNEEALKEARGTTPACGTYLTI
jgi:hypothetical protein